MTPPQDTHQKREGERESLMSSLSLQIIQQSTGARGDKRPFEHLEAIASRAQVGPVRWGHVAGPRRRLEVAVFLPRLAALLSAQHDAPRLW